MERLKKRADFLAAATGVRCPAEGFVLLVRSREDQGPGRIGFTVSKKVGNAVERNRVRRRLRETVRLAPVERIKPGHDYVLIGRRAALTRPFERLAGDLESALRRADMPRERTSATARRRPRTREGQPAHDENPR